MCQHITNHFCINSTLKYSLDKPGEISKCCNCSLLLRQVILLKIHIPYVFKTSYELFINSIMTVFLLYLCFESHLSYISVIILYLMYRETRSSSKQFLSRIKVFIISLPGLFTKTDNWNIFFSPKKYLIHWQGMVTFKA